MKHSRVVHGWLSPVHFTRLRYFNISVSAFNTTEDGLLIDSRRHLRLINIAFEPKDYISSVAIGQTPLAAAFTTDMLKIVVYFNWAMQAVTKDKLVLVCCSVYTQMYVTIGASLMRSRKWKSAFDKSYFSSWCYSRIWREDFSDTSEIAFK